MIRKFFDLQPRVNDPIFEKASPSGVVLQKHITEINAATGFEDIYNVLKDAFSPVPPLRETPLFDQLVAGAFNSVTWQQFVKIVERIVLEEEIAWTELHEPILAYLDDNEPLSGYNTEELAA